jgi:hypothetical protein
MEFGSLIIHNIQKMVPDNTDSNKSLKVTKYKPILVAVRSKEWDCGFESRQGHRCLCIFSVVYCQVEVSRSEQ